MLNKNHNLFITYIRTKMFWQGRLKNTDLMNPVYVSTIEIRERFFGDPVKEIKVLVDAGQIEISTKDTQQGHKATYYKSLKPGGIRPSMLKPNGKELDILTKYMMEILKLVTLKENATSTLYFDTFLILKHTNIKSFFTVDDFSGRVHTPVSSFHRPYRSNILINGQNVKSLDVVTMQPLLLGKVLKKEIGENDYSTWINRGEDIYLIIQDKAKLNNRDEAKKRFFEILFSKPNKRLSELFGHTNWIEWINSFKGQLFKPNPHSAEKNHSNLAWLLQTTEVAIMRKVWQSLKDQNIAFLSVHDEILIQQQDFYKAEQIFIEVLNKEFEFFKLSSKVNKPTEFIPLEPSDSQPSPPATTYTLDQLQAIARAQCKRNGIIRDETKYYKAWAHSMEETLLNAGFSQEQFINSLNL